jgi:hypothetical protein
MHGGSNGYGMCYLYGYYRGAGLSREAALAAVCDAMITPEEPYTYGP